MFIGVFAAANANIGCQINGGPAKSGKACLPYVPHGPGGEVVTDSFYFVHQPLTGNGSITARVTSLTGEHANITGGPVQVGSGRSLVPGLAPWSKAGIIIKQSTHQGSAYAAMMVTGSNGVRMQYNYTGDTAGLPGKVSAAHPRWLRLTRSGDTITGYDSADGTHWTRVGTAQLAGLPATVQVGMFATSPGYTVTQNSFGGHSNNGGPSQATGVFDHVSLTGAAAAAARGPAPRSAAADRSARGRPATQRRAGSARRGGTFTLTGSGDIAPVTPGPGSGLPTVTIEQSLAGAFLGLIAIVVVAAMFFTAEYRRGLIRTTLAATPRRGAGTGRQGRGDRRGGVRHRAGRLRRSSVAVGVPKEQNQGLGAADRARADRGAGHRRHRGDAGRGRRLRRRPRRRCCAAAPPPSRSRSWPSCCRSCSTALNVVPVRRRRVAAAAHPGRRSGDPAEHPAVPAGHHRPTAPCGLLPAVAVGRLRRAVPLGGGRPRPGARPAPAARRMSALTRAGAARGDAGQPAGRAAATGARAADRACTPSGPSCARCRGPPGCCSAVAALTIAVSAAAVGATHCPPA